MGVIITKGDIMYSTSLVSASSATSAAQGIGIWTIIAAILAVIGGILLYFLFVKPSEEPKNKFLAGLKKFLAFKTMWIETLIKVIYYITTIFVVLASFSLISVSFVSFIFMLVVVPVLIRLAYEGAIMFVMVWRNTADIAQNTKK